MGSARLANDPNKYVRFIKGKFQARPYDEGVRYDLGLFPTAEQARKAVSEFWWGKRESLPRFVKKVRTRTGEVYLALGPVARGTVVVVSRHETREEAAVAAEAWVRREWGELADGLMVRGVPTRERVRVKKVREKKVKKATGKRVQRDEGARWWRMAGL